jgi:4-diphosphocytidyl-2-C-methyl-D-erythritol kinase
VFQTISLADASTSSSPRRAARPIQIDGDVDIPDNLMAKAAMLALDAMRVTARSIPAAQTNSHGRRLGRRIVGCSRRPAGVARARRTPPGNAALMELAAELGSDVPFFLLGGAAVALGRGTELYPLPDSPPRRGLLVAPGACFHGLRVSRAHPPIDNRIATK